MIKNLKGPNGSICHTSVMNSRTAAPSSSTVQNIQTPNLKIILKVMHRKKFNFTTCLLGANERLKSICEI
jgi:hypothetical protein